MEKVYIRYADQTTTLQHIDDGIRYSNVKFIFRTFNI